MAIGQHRVVRAKNKRNWDVVNPKGVVVEGGFFEYDEAIIARNQWDAGISRCPDCGVVGEQRGHQTCQYPR